MVRLVVATKNKGKMKELRAILSEVPVLIQSMEEADIDMDVEETGATFEENALLKADAILRFFADRSEHVMVLADDSGLEVDALQGAPGIYSARYGGPGLDDAGRWQLLLKNMEGVTPCLRTGRFVCAAAVVANNRRMVVRGTVEGTILEAPRGSNGFGYDPVFLVTEAGKSAAELDEAEKNRISHRGRALEQILEALSGPEWSEVIHPGQEA